MEEFTKRHTTTECAELLLPAPDPSERNAAYYAKCPCARFVATAADIIAETLGKPGHGDGP